VTPTETPFYSDNPIGVFHGIGRQEPIRPRCDPLHNHYGSLGSAIGIYGALYLSTSQPQAYYAGPVVVGALFVIAGYQCLQSRKSRFIISAVLSLLIVAGQLAFDGLGPLPDLTVVLAGPGYAILRYPRISELAEDQARLKVRALLGPFSRSDLDSIPEHVQESFHNPRKSNNTAIERTYRRTKNHLVEPNSRWSTV